MPITLVTPVDRFYPPGLVALVQRIDLTWGTVMGGEQPRLRGDARFDPVDVCRQSLVALIDGIVKALPDDGEQPANAEDLGLEEWVSHPQRQRDVLTDYGFMLGAVCHLGEQNTLTMVLEAQKAFTPVTRWEQVQTQNNPSDRIKKALNKAKELLLSGLLPYSMDSEKAVESAAPADRSASPDGEKKPRPSGGGRQRRNTLVADAMAVAGTLALGIAACNLVGPPALIAAFSVELTVTLVALVAKRALNHDKALPTPGIELQL